MKPRIDKNGYLRLGLFKNKKQKHFNIHRLVAQAFIPNPNNYPVVNHKDENKQNNCITNLEWCNTEYNNNYGNRTLKSSLTKQKKIVQYDLKGNIIKIWNFESRLLLYTIQLTNSILNAFFDNTGEYIIANLYGNNVAVYHFPKLQDIISKNRSMLDEIDFSEELKKKYYLEY